MKVCIKDKRMNFDYHKIYGEEKTKTDGYTIFEVPDEYRDCAFEDFDGNGFNVNLYNKRKQGYVNQDKIAELDNWFKTDYTTYEQMLRRRKELGIEDVIVDEFRNKTYHDLFELYTEAEVVAKEIRELRK